jgi:hypothetical protein
MATKLTTAMVIANVLMSLLVYLSSQLVLFNLNAPPQNPITVAGFNFFSINVQPPQVGSGVILPLAWAIPNYPSYFFALFLIVNALFMIKLLIDKKPKPNPS